MELKRVVVTGLGALTPIGNDVKTTWENAVNGVSGAGPITHFDASKFKTQFACEVKDFNPADHFDRKKARTLDLYAMYALVAADEAINDANLENENVDKNRVGVIFAAGIGGLHTFEEEAGYYALHGEEQGPKYQLRHCIGLRIFQQRARRRLQHRAPRHGRRHCCRRC